MKLRKGSHDATGMRFGLVVAKFNKFVTSKLLSSCLDGLTKHGVKDQDIEVARVPGAFELPLVAKTLAKSGRFDAVICLGAVIRGDTPHFDYICNEASRGIGQAAALALARAGADVALASRKLPDLEKVAAEIKGMGRQSLAVAAHVAKRAGAEIPPAAPIERMIRAVIRPVGRGADELLPMHVGRNRRQAGRPRDDAG